MSAECADGRLVPLPLDREERWVVHAVLLDYVETATMTGTDASALGCELSALWALENGDSAFTVDELDRIRHEVAAHGRAHDTPDRDRGIAQALVDRLDDRLATQPA